MKTLRRLNDWKSRRFSFRKRVHSCCILKSGRLLSLIMRILKVPLWSRRKFRKLGRLFKFRTNLSRNWNNLIRKIKKCKMIVSFFKIINNKLNMIIIPNRRLLDKIYNQLIHKNKIISKISFKISSKILIKIIFKISSKHQTLLKKNSKIYYIFINFYFFLNYSIYFCIFLQIFIYF